VNSLQDLLNQAMNHDPTQVITTVLLRDGDAAHWTATRMAGTDRILLQDCSLNVGIMGTHKQLREMVSRMTFALLRPVAEETINENAEGEPANVG
jgi:hypothetical protein